MCIMPLHNNRWLDPTMLERKLPKSDNDGDGGKEELLPAEAQEGMKDKNVI